MNQLYTMFLLWKNNKQNKSDKNCYGNIMQKIRPARLEGGGMAAPPDVDACENGLF